MNCSFNSLFVGAFNHFRRKWVVAPLSTSSSSSHAPTGPPRRGPADLSCSTTFPLRSSTSLPISSESLSSGEDRRRKRDYSQPSIPKEAVDAVAYEWQEKLLTAYAREYVPSVPRTRFEHVRVHLRNFLDNPSVMLTVLFFVLWSMFAPDVATIVSNDAVKKAFYVGDIICFVLLSIEIGFESVGRVKYFLKSYFWLDFVATVSILFELKEVRELLYLWSTDHRLESNDGIHAVGEHALVVHYLERVAQIIRMSRMLTMVHRWNPNRRKQRINQFEQTVRRRIKFVFRFVDEDMDGKINFRQFQQACKFVGVAPPLRNPAASKTAKELNEHERQEGGKCRRTSKCCRGRTDKRRKQNLKSKRRHRRLDDSSSPRRGWCWKCRCWKPRRESEGDDDEEREEEEERHQVRNNKVGKEDLGGGNHYKHSMSTMSDVHHRYHDDHHFAEDIASVPCVQPLFYHETKTKATPPLSPSPVSLPLGPISPAPGLICSQAASTGFFLPQSERRSAEGFTFPPLSVTSLGILQRSSSSLPCWSSIFPDSPRSYPPAPLLPPSPSSSEVSTVGEDEQRPKSRRLPGRSFTRAASDNVDPPFLFRRSPSLNPTPKPRSVRINVELLTQWNGEELVSTPNKRMQDERERAKTKYKKGVKRKTEQSRSSTAPYRHYDTQGNAESGSPSNSAQQMTNLDISIARLPRPLLVSSMFHKTASSSSPSNCEQTERPEESGTDNIANSTTNSGNSTNTTNSTISGTYPITNSLSCISLPSSDVCLTPGSGSLRRAKSMFAVRQAVRFGSVTMYPPMPPVITPDEWQLPSSNRRKVKKGGKTEEKGAVKKPGQSEQLVKPGQEEVLVEAGGREGLTQNQQQQQLFSRHEHNRTTNESTIEMTEETNNKRQTDNHLSNDKKYDYSGNGIFHKPTQRQKMKRKTANKKKVDDAPYENEEDLYASDRDVLYDESLDASSVTGGEPADSGGGLIAAGSGGMIESSDDACLRESARPVLQRGASSHSSSSRGSGDFPFEYGTAVRQSASSRPGTLGSIESEGSGWWEDTLGAGRENEVRYTFPEFEECLHQVDATNQLSRWAKHLTFQKDANIFAAEVSENMIFKVVIGVVLIIMVVGLIDSFTFPSWFIDRALVHHIDIMAQQIANGDNSPGLRLALSRAVDLLIQDEDTIGRVFYIKVRGFNMLDQRTTIGNLSNFEVVTYQIGGTTVKASIRDFVRRWSQSNLVLVAFITLLIFVGLYFFNRDSNRLAQKLVYPLQALADDVEAMAYLDTHNIVGDYEYSKIYEIRQLQEAFGLMKQGLLSFAKYVPREVVGITLRRGEEARLGGEAKQLTIMFSDIVGFTTIAEQLQPRDLLGLLSQYFQGMSNIILKSRGTLIEFIGDAILAVWNAPLSVLNHAPVAIAQALKMQEYLASRQTEWSRKGLPTIRIRCGIHTAKVLVGNLGSPERIKFGVLGDGVNLASRLEELNKRYGTNILISEVTAEQPHVRTKFLLRPVDVVVVKGRSKGTQLFEVVNFRELCTTQQVTVAENQAEALRYFLRGNFSGCLSHIRLIEKSGLSAVSAQELKAKALRYSRDPPPADWDGAEVLYEKTF